MIFFLFSLIILYVYYRNRKAGYLMAGITFAITFASSFYTSYHYGLSNSFLKYDSKFFKYYYAPYNRFPSYCIGLICGFIYYQWKQEGKLKNIVASLEKNTFLRTLISFLGFAGMITIVWQMYWFNKDIEKVTKIQDMLQFGLSRPLFVIGLFMFCIPTLLGKGIILKYIFDNAFWEISSNFTYATYLLHLIVLKVYMMTITAGYSFSLARSFFIFYAVALVVYILGYVFTVIFESPIVLLEVRFILPPNKPKKVMDLSLIHI